MAEFEDLNFIKTKLGVDCYLYKIFKFSIPDDDLKNAGVTSIKKNSIETKNMRKFEFILSKNILNLKNTISQRKAVYIHKNLGLSLIGTSYFGIIDRGTNVIELRPITSCNLSCVFCSVDEGSIGKKAVDYVVEKDYLVEETKKLIEFKGNDQIEVCINPQGEPMLYFRLKELIYDISKIKGVIVVSMNTNSTMLTKEIIDELIDSGLSRINFSLNAMTKDLANKLSCVDYDFDKVKSLIEYASKKIDLNIAPVLIKGVNESEIEQMIPFVKELSKKTKKSVFLGIQNMLNYKSGRNFGKQMEWDEFFSMLDTWEKKYSINLRKSPHITFVQTKQLEKPFKKNDIITSQIVCAGRQKHEMIAQASDRAISVINTDLKENDKIKLKIIRTKDNIFTASQI